MTGSTDAIRMQAEEELATMFRLPRFRVRAYSSYGGDTVLYVIETPYAMWPCRPFGWLRTAPYRPSRLTAFGNCVLAMVNTLEGVKAQTGNSYTLQVFIEGEQLRNNPPVPRLHYVTYGLPANVTTAIQEAAITHDSLGKRIDAFVDAMASTH